MALKARKGIAWEFDEIGMISVTIAVIAIVLIFAKKFGIGP